MMRRRTTLVVPRACREAIAAGARCVPGSPDGAWPGYQGIGPSAEQNSPVRPVVGEGGQAHGGDGGFLVAGAERALAVVEASGHIPRGCRVDLDRSVAEPMVVDTLTTRAAAARRSRPVIALVTAIAPNTLVS